MRKYSHAYASAVILYESHTHTDPCAVTSLGYTHVHECVHMCLPGTYGRDPCFTAGATQSSLWPSSESPLAGTCVKANNKQDADSACTWIWSMPAYVFWFMHHFDNCESNPLASSSCKWWHICRRVCAHCASDPPFGPDSAPCVNIALHSNTKYLVRKNDGSSHAINICTHTHMRMLGRIMLVSIACCRWQLLQKESSRHFSMLLAGSFSLLQTWRLLWEMLFLSPLLCM